MDPGKQPSPVAPDGLAGNDQPAASPPTSEAPQSLDVQTTMQQQVVAGAQPPSPAPSTPSSSASSSLALTGGAARSNAGGPLPPAGGPVGPSKPRGLARRRSPARLAVNNGACRVLGASSCASPWAHAFASLDSLPNEVLLHILGFLDVNDLLSTSRASHHLRCLCVAPILHILRRRRIRAALARLLLSPSRPSLSDLISRSIFLTSTTVVSRRLARSLASIRLSRRLAARPPVQVLVERCVLPPECAPGIGHVAPALAARTRTIEREKLKDGLRRWVGAVWKREVGRRSERIRKSEESVGIGKVWRLRKFWERVGRGDG